MIWRHEFPQDAGFYWCDALHLGGPLLIFIEKGAIEEEVIAQLRTDYPNATDFHWCRHDSDQVTHDATTYLVSNPDAKITRIEHRLSAESVSFVQVTHKDGSYMTFGKE